MRKARSVVWLWAAALPLFLAGRGPTPADTLVVLNCDTDLHGTPIANNTPVHTAYPLPGGTFGADDVVQLGGGGVTSHPHFATGSPHNFASPFDVFFTHVANFIEAKNVTTSWWTLTAYDVNDHVLGAVAVSHFTEVGHLTFTGLIKRAQFTTAS
jgi:hypothetical protein